MFLKNALPIVGLLLSLTVPTLANRQTILMDANWRFLPEHAQTVPKGTLVTQWQWNALDGNAAESDWADAHIGDDVFHGRHGSAWYRTTLPSTSARPAVIHFEAIDDNAVVYLNGVEIGKHQGWNDPFDVGLGSAWKPNGPNVVLVRVENTDGAGGIVKPVVLTDRENTSIPKPGPGWSTVHLPHDYVVNGPFDQSADAGHGSLPTYPAWYERTFTLPAADKGKDVWLDFDGVYRDAKVYLNGKLIGRHESGYTPFRFDIAKVARYGAANILDVHVDPRRQEGWWYEGGGIYRHVWLTVADPLHIVPNGVFVTSTVKNPLHNPSATIKIQTTIHNGTAAPNVSLFFGLHGPNGQAVTAQFAIAKVKGDQTITTTFQIPHADLWSIEHPQLYQLRTTVGRPGQKTIIDTVDTSFGIRTIRFDANKGFFLNERPVKLKGTCNHQDFAGIGVAVPDNMEYWRVRKLKEMGSNAWRTSHNPPTASLLDACDRLGMLVMDENRHLGDTFNPKTPRGTTTDDLSELDAMVLRDRNHPSVIMWSMCNEEPLQWNDEGAKIFTAMRKRTLKLDPTRPVTCAMNDSSYEGIALVEDLRGFNYNPQYYASYHAAHPNDILYGSETASTVSTRGVYDHSVFARDNHKYMGDEAAGYVSAYDVNAPPWAETAEDAWQPLVPDYMAGGFVWTGFDYKGEPTPFGWPCVNSHFGIIDEAGFPKDIYYYYQSVWGNKPMVHVLPHWNWPGKDGQTIDVWAFSNAAKVDLVLNGKSLGAQAMPANGHLQWNVPYAPGTLEAVGYDTNGKAIVTDSVSTTGEPTAIRLVDGGNTLAANGEDIDPVEVDIVDANGLVVPTASNRVTFKVTGPGRNAGVGNGDPSDHDPDHANFRRAFNGKCLVNVGDSEKPGVITVTATSPGLKPATIKIKVAAH